MCQINTLYALNLYNSMCKSVNKARKRKGKKVIKWSNKPEDRILRNMFKNEMNEFDEVRNRLCFFLTSLTKPTKKNLNRSVQKHPSIPFGISQQSSKHVCDESAFCPISSPAFWKQRKETQRPRNVLLMWYRLALVVKTERDIEKENHNKKELPYGQVHW